MRYEVRVASRRRVILSLGTALRAVDGGRNLGSSRTGLNGPGPHKHRRVLRSRRNRGGGWSGGAGGDLPTKNVSHRTGPVASAERGTASPPPGLSAQSSPAATRT